MKSVAQSIGSGPILTDGKQGRRQGNFKENDFPGLAGTLK